MPTPITNIGQIAINTHDVQRAVAFYRDALGLDYLFEAGPLAFFMCGDVRLMLSEAESPSSTIRARSSTSVSTTSTRLAPSSPSRCAVRRRAASDRGMPDHELWMTFFRDPDHNVHGLMSEVT